jgi:hypothetical protein
MLMKGIVIVFFLAYFPYFEKKNEIGLMRSSCCLCVSEPPLHQLLNGGTNLCETWYVYLGT